MIIDFNKIAEEEIIGFKGGEGLLLTRNYVDNKCKIMRSVLKPGASSGLHKHEANCEIVYILSGVATFNYDGQTETVATGGVHYCPEGHSHFMVNNQKEDLVYLAIVPELVQK